MEEKADDLSFVLLISSPPLSLALMSQDKYVCLKIKQGTLGTTYPKVYSMLFKPGTIRPRHTVKDTAPGQSSAHTILHYFPL